MVQVLLSAKPFICDTFFPVQFLFFSLNPLASFSVFLLLSLYSFYDKRIASVNIDIRPTNNA